jgi:hypothetical protein
MVQSELRVDVEGDHIFVTLTGTGLRARYFRSPDEPKLIQSYAVEIDKGAPLPRKEFEALAWEAASEKARELGWIC